MEDKTFNRLVVTAFAIATLILARTFTVGANHFYISNAILAYKLDCIHSRHTIDYTIHFDDMESFETTWWRMWDWSNKRILDYAQYLKIRPYIGDVVWDV